AGCAPAGGMRVASRDPSRGHPAVYKRGVLGSPPRAAPAQQRQVAAAKTCGRGQEVELLLTGQALLQIARDPRCRLRLVRVATLVERIAAEPFVIPPCASWMCF